MFFITCTAVAPPRKPDPQTEKEALIVERDALSKRVIEAKDELIEAQKARIRELELKLS